MKRIACIMIVLCLLLAGCSAQDKLIGTWEAQVDLAQMITDELDLSQEMSDFTVDDFTVTMVLTFLEDGTYRVSIREESMQAAFEKLLSDMEAAMRTTLEKEMEAGGAGMSADEMLGLLGMTMDELISSLMEEVKIAMEEENVIGETLEEAKVQGQYKAEGGKLYMSDELSEAVEADTYEVYKLSGSTMTWTEHAGDDALELQGLYPVVWTKTA